MNSKVLKLIDAYEKYIKALEDELSSVSTIAYVHGWRSEKYEEGVKLREEIIASKKELKEDINKVEEEKDDYKPFIENELQHCAYGENSGMNQGYLNYTQVINAMNLLMQKNAIGPLIKKSNKVNVEEAAEAVDTFLNWAFKNYQWTGDTWDENTGHDDFESYTHKELFKEWQEDKV